MKSDGGSFSLTRPESLRFRLGWMALLLNGIAILGFGLVAVVLPGAEAAHLRAIGAASIGMGLFGTVVTLTAFRRHERWAFLILCYYPLFWTAHLVGDLPPGKDHVHQVFLIALSLLGLVLSIREFFPPGADHDLTRS